MLERVHACHQRQHDRHGQQQMGGQRQHDGHEKDKQRPDGIKAGLCDDFGHQAEHAQWGDPHDQVRHLQHDLIHAFPEIFEHFARLSLQACGQEAKQDRKGD